MNKAFVKEDSDSNNDFNFDFDPSDQDTSFQDDFDAIAPSFGGPKNYITKPGFDRLKAELDHLTNNERPQILNLESDTDPNSNQLRLREVERRIRYLQRRVDLAEVVIPEQQTGDQVLFGATVTVLDENEKTHVYQVVGIDETDAPSGKISWISPIGQALLQAKVGDFAIVHLPSGEEDLEILKIEYKPIT